jgi:hypothetical protein
MSSSQDSPLPSLNNSYEEEHKIIEVEDEDEEEIEIEEQQDHLLWLESCWHNTLCKKNKLQTLKKNLEDFDKEANDLLRESHLIFNSMFKKLDELIEEDHIRQTLTYESNLQSKCTICQYKGTECKLKCGHSFHIDCIYDWFLFNNICPNCRAINHNKIQLN